MSARRPLPAWLYAVPDGRNVRIAELEAALLETNDAAARLRHIALVLIGSNYSLDEERSERFLSSWIGDASVRWKRS